jgi:hypothetical protein
MLYRIPQPLYFKEICLLDLIAYLAPSHISRLGRSSLSCSWLSRSRLGHSGLSRCTKERFTYDMAISADNWHDSRNEFFFRKTR